MPSDRLPIPLSKTRFVAGWQCHKLLWWKVREPDAVELQPDEVLQDRFDQGIQVGEIARTRFPGGKLIDLPYYDREGKIAATRAALDTDAPAIFEASFTADDVFVAVDVLERADGGCKLIEVKSSSRQKPEHVPDVAVQTHVLRRCGIDVRRAEVMHLNQEFRHPDEGDLFDRTDVTTQVEAMLSGIPVEIERQLDVLKGPLPEVGVGLHCFEPYECPFVKRCWPTAPDHIMKLVGVGPKKGCAYMQRGIHEISDLPAKQKLSAPAKRQVRAMKENRLVVEPGLRKALEPFDCKLGFLDFETISRAVPVWPGMGPWHQAAAQFSYHEANGHGTYSRAEFLAEGPEDARPLLADALVRATTDVARIVTYTSFEKTCIRDLRDAVPRLAAELEQLEAKLIDLHPVVRDHVYHPDFEGSFSLKYILHPLVPELSYGDLVIEDGQVASVEIARLLFVAGEIALEQREKTRRDLLDYCERDTWAMVKLLERLRELVGD
jgi:predicted RecB family nuclease